MYKTKTLLLVCSLLTFLMSCDNEPENHQLTPVEGSIILYADQTTDSLSFYTFDNWSVTPQVDWINVVGKSREDNIKYDYTKCYLYTVFVSAKPNTTGKTRVGTVLVQSYDYSYSLPFVQLGLLNVTHPYFTADSWLSEQANIPEVAHFELKDSAHWTSDSICFTVDDNWELMFADETAPDWLSFGEQELSGLRGKHKVIFTLVPNTDTENGREAKLKLVCREITNEIVVRQLPDKKKAE